MARIKPEGRASPTEQVTWDDEAMLKACINGPRTPAEHPGVPVRPEELARDVAAVVAAGADAVHLHVKDALGADTLDGSAMAAVLAAVRESTPDVPIGVTTGAWALPDPVRRVSLIRSWEHQPLLPDFASVNWHEEGADDVAAVLVALGIGVEAGLWHEAGARAWLSSPHRDMTLRVLLELPDGLSPDEVQAEAPRLLGLLERAGIGQGDGPPVLLHGEGTTAWPALRLAGRLKLSTRIGLEDVLYLPNGSPAPDNAALVRTARELLFPAVGSAAG